MHIFIYLFLIWNFLKQASLPANVGGLGFKCAEDLALPAFIAGSTAAKPLANSLYWPLGEDISLSNAQANWLALTGVTEIPALRKQRDLEEPIVSSLIQTFVVYMNFHICIMSVSCINTSIHTWSLFPIHEKYMKFHVSCIDKFENYNYGLFNYISKKIEKNYKLTTY